MLHVSEWIIAYFLKNVKSDFLSNFVLLPYWKNAQMRSRGKIVKITLCILEKINAILTKNQTGNQRHM